MNFKSRPPQHFVMVFLLNLFASAQILAAAPPSASLDTFTLGYRGEYFFSTQNLSGQSGDTDTLQFDGKYSSFTNNFEFAYTLPIGLRFALGGSFAYAESTTSYEPRDNSQYTRTSISGEFYKNFGRLLFVPMVLVNISSEKIDPYQNDVFTSEGSDQYQFGAWTKYPIWKFDNWIYLGYRMQGDQKADHAVWSVGTRFYPRRWFISGEVTGYVVTRHDENEIVPGVRTYVNGQVAGGSLKYNAVDPEFMEGEILGGYRSKSGYEFSVGANQTITGKNTGYGTTVLVGFSMDFRMDEKNLDNANRVSDTGDFKPDFETYDESTFKDE